MKKEILLNYFVIFLIQVNHLEINQFDEGKKLFFQNCLPCHIGGRNIILPEKNLTKASLTANGLTNPEAITYQILNGKNGMPAFGNRLKENEIEKIAYYVFQQSETNFEEILPDKK